MDDPINKFSDENNGRKLDEDQKKAASTPLENTLVVSRAGSGKTHVLIARAIYLQEIAGIHPTEILMLAFNNKAQKEIRERLEDSANGPFPFALTFHSLGYNVVKPKQKILFDDTDGDDKKLTRAVAGLENKNRKLTLVQAVVNLSKDLLKKDNSEFQKKFYQLVEAKINKTATDIASGNLEVEIVDDEIFRKSKLYDESSSLDGTIVKSYGEKIISDVLFTNDIKYHYEKVFFWDGDPYRPDFAIKNPEREGGVVIEYFGMSNKDYKEQIVRKKNYWDSQENWNLLEVYPNQFAANAYPEFERELLEKLDSLGIPNRKLSVEELIQRMPEELGPSRYTQPFVSFITKCRTKKIHPTQLEVDIANFSTDDEEVALFYKLVLELYREYLETIIGEKFEDFPGILHRAAEQINQGNIEISVPKPRRKLNLQSLKHILIDEFQDFSPAFFSLIEAIRNMNPEVKVFCVGDDWQAINGFMGAELKYLKDFQEYFHNPNVLSMNTNYRSVPKIVEVSNEFMSGFEEIPILPRSHVSTRGRTFLWVDDECHPSDKEKIMLEGEPQIFLIILRILQKKLKANPESTIAVLCRTNNPVRGDDDMTISEFSKRLEKFIEPKHSDQVTVNTVHRYKGKEADCVILTNVESFYYPLIHPDIKFEEIFGVSEASVTVEERRLFYVALTRAKNSLHIITSSESKSDFLNDLSLEEMSFDDLDEIKPVQSEIEIRIYESLYGREKNQILKNAGFIWNPTGNYWVRKYPEAWWRGPQTVTGEEWHNVAIKFDVIDERSATIKFTSNYKRLCLTGETFDIKEHLKSDHFKYDGETQEWYRDFPSWTSNKILLDTLRKKPWSSRGVNAEIRIL